MLTISKPTIFSPDGFAARGQCSHDSPGWQLRWFDKGEPVTMLWQGAFKTCRHLQSNCLQAASLDEARRMVDELLASNSATQFTSQPTDAYPTTPRVDQALGESHPPSGSQPHAGPKKRRKKKH